MLLVASNVPPVGALYQLIDSGDEVFNVTLPEPHLETSDAEGADGVELTIACAGTLLLWHTYPASA